MNIGSSWKRTLVVGCSHGLFADPAALQSVLQFKENFKPQITVHLGDFCDTSAFMSRNLRDGDGDPVGPDVDGGLDFLSKLRPNYVLAGNHEARLDRLAESKNELISFAAGQVLDRIHTHCRKLKASYVPYTGIEQSLILGNVRMMHGVMYSENAVRDHAEAFAPWKGTVLHAHTHRAGMATGRRADSPLGFCVGTLTARGALEYASTRRATLGWSIGFVWGYLSDKSSQLYLCQKQSDTWILPT